MSFVSRGGAIPDVFTLKIEILCTKALTSCLGILLKELVMAIISMFYGIIISMYYMDNKQHNLPISM